jgi:hypothetical protein
VWYILFKWYQWWCMTNNILYNEWFFLFLLLLCSKSQEVLHNFYSGSPHNMQFLIMICCVYMIYFAIGKMEFKNWITINNKNIFKGKLQNSNEIFFYATEKIRVMLCCTRSSHHFNSQSRRKKQQQENEEGEKRLHSFVLFSPIPLMVYL